MLKSYIHAGTALIRLFMLKWFGQLDNIQFTKRNHFGNHVSLYVDKGSTLRFGKDVGLRDNVCISVRNKASICLGDGVFLNNGCQVIAHNSIILEDHVRCGQNTMFFDHDYDFRGGGVSSKQFISAPIHVGEGTWIGAGCIILKGTSIGKNCVIGAGSVVKGTIPDNHIYIQKRDTCVLPVLCQD